MMRLALLLLAAPALAQVEVPGFVRMARLADVDGDGAKDVAVLCAQGGWDPAMPEVDARKDTLFVFFERNGKLAAGPAVPLPSPASSFWVLDVDGDRVPDLLASTRGGIVRVATDGTTAPFLDDAFLHEDGSTLELEIARDVDGDGRPDLVLPTGTGVIYRLWREGVPILSAPGADVPVKAVNLEAEAPTLFARVAAEGSPPRLSFLRPIPSARDLDGDGRLDAVLPLAARLAEVEGIRVRFGEEGTPLFGPTERGIEIAHAHGEVLGGEEALAFGDLDGDRVMELGLLTYDVEGLSLRATRRLRVIHFGKGYVPDAAPWLDVDTDANLWEPSRLALDDLDGDGRGDVLVTHIGGLRKASFTAELYRRSASGRFEKEDQTLKIGKDEKVDRSFLPAPVDLDGDGKSDFLVAGKAVVYELGGIFQDGMVFTEPARKVTRIEGADKVLAVLVDPRPKSASPYYVVTRQKNGRNLITRVP